ncbi:MAG: vWA domain-containing protein, partial [Gammaproteobacteria bacterium]
MPTRPSSRTAFLTTGLAALLALTAAGCSSAPDDADEASYKTRLTKAAASQSALALMSSAPPPLAAEQERYADLPPNPVQTVAEQPVSTFSVDVDTASYANVRRFLDRGELPPTDAVRIEEMLNYFRYDYARPGADGAPFAVHAELLPAPWKAGRQLLHIGLQGRSLPQGERPPLNLTLLVDVSGSMGSPDKLPLARKVLKEMLDRLYARDTLAMAVYAGAAGVVLPPTPGDRRGRILEALGSLEAGGSTAGGEGLRLAYDLARQGFEKGKVNRVMILTDGDFNVGLTDPAQLEDVVARERDGGVYLSVLGFGGGNYNDALMQRLAQRGNGIAAYIDSVAEGRKVLGADFAGSMLPIADDVKVQVEFNPQRVREYRLVGYESRMLRREDFANDRVDAGDVGSGHSVTAIYEIVTTDAPAAATFNEPLRYPPAGGPSAGAGAAGGEQAKTKADEFAFVRVRYKPPGSAESRLIERPVTARDRRPTLDAASESARFAAAVAGYGLLLRRDP